MPVSKEEETARAFIERVNAGDVAGIGALMTEGHVFVDALGKRYQGKGVMQPAWSSYFEMFPDYRIEVEMAVAEAEGVALFGTARATYADSGESWEVPAAWLAIVHGGLVAEWRVYCDNGFGPLRDIVARAEGD